MSLGKLVKSLFLTAAPLFIISTANADDPKFAFSDSPCFHTADSARIDYNVTRKFVFDTIDDKETFFEIYQEGDALVMHGQIDATFLQIYRIALNIKEYLVNGETVNSIIARRSLIGTDASEEEITFAEANGLPTDNLKWVFSEYFDYDKGTILNQIGSIEKKEYYCEIDSSNAILPESHTMMSAFLSCLHWYDDLQEENNDTIKQDVRSFDIRYRGITYKEIEATLTIENDVATIKTDLGNIISLIGELSFSFSCSEQQKKKKRIPPYVPVPGAKIFGVSVKANVIDSYLE